MASGTVKWFNPTKGYGFIQPSDGGKDVFVHVSAVERAGLSSLNEGQKVEYELVSNRGKTSAENLKVMCSTAAGARATRRLLTPLLARHWSASARTTQIPNRPCSRCDVRRAFEHVVSRARL